MEGRKRRTGRRAATTGRIILLALTLTLVTASSSPSSFSGVDEGDQLIHRLPLKPQLQYVRKKGGRSSLAREKEKMLRACKLDIDFSLFSHLFLSLSLHFLFFSSPRFCSFPSFPLCVKGADGHLGCAAIASAYLHPNTKAQLAILIPETSPPGDISAIASWADAVKDY